MSISKKIKDAMDKSSWIRKMFETGNELKAKYGTDAVMDFSLGNPIQEPPSKFNEILKNIISERTVGSHRYMSNNGFEEVRRMVADAFNAELELKKVSSSDVIMTVGAAGAINIILKSILDENDEVILIRPYFPEYLFYVDNHGGKVIIVDSADGFALDISNIKNALNEKTKAIIINSPNNPTGVIYSKESLIRLSEVLDEHKIKTGRSVYLISDEPYRKIKYIEDKLPAVTDIFQNAIFCTSHSKDLGLAGERIGYAIVSPDCDAHDDLISALIFSNRTLGFVNAPALMQKTVAHLQNESVNIEDYKIKRDYIYEHLSDAGYDIVKPTGAFYYFIKTPTENDVDFINTLMKYNILTVPGSGFGQPGYFRLSYCVEMSVIEKAMPLFKKALEEF